MRCIILLFSMLILSTSGYAQKTEIEAGFGAASVYSITESFIDALASVVSKSDYEVMDSGTLVFAVTRYNSTMKWRYGGEFNTEFFKTKGKLASLTYYSISPKLDYFWSPPENKLRVYSGASLGILFRSSRYYGSDGEKHSENFSTVGVNLAFIGLRYGENFAGFFDINLGNKGILQAGINYIF